MAPGWESAFDTAKGMRRCHLSKWPNGLRFKGIFHLDGERRYPFGFETPTGRRWASTPGRFLTCRVPLPRC